MEQQGKWSEQRGGERPWSAYDVRRLRAAAVWTDASQMVWMTGFLFFGAADRVEGVRAAWAATETNS